jgi:hypothetical protein
MCRAWLLSAWFETWSGYGGGVVTAKRFGKTLSRTELIDICDVSATGFRVHRPGLSPNYNWWSWTKDVTSLSLRSLIYKIRLTVFFLGC